MKRITALSILGATLAGATGGVLYAAEPTQGYQPCLDYFQVGPSGCKPARPLTPPSPTYPPIIHPSSTPSPSLIPPTSAAPSLDTKIDDFLANHGKPPREFVAFYLDPTPDNAMKWISKYNELLDRNTQIAVAWTQAETLYARALHQGVSATALASSTLPPVPDFGVALPGFTDNPALVGTSLPGVTYTPMGGAPGMATPPNPNVTSPIQTMLSDAAGLRGVPAPTAEPFSAVRPLEAGGRLGSPLIVVSRSTPDAPIAIAKPELTLTYYFSSVCPYCAKFAPELNKALASVPDVRISCVDVTGLVSSKPATPDYITQAVPRCQWRLPNEGEINSNQVSQTPTLLVQWGAGQPQKIQGYVDAARLIPAFQSGGLLGQ